MAASTIMRGKKNGSYTTDFKQKYFPQGLIITLTKLQGADNAVHQSNLVNPLYLLFGELFQNNSRYILCLTRRELRGGDRL